MSKWTLNLESSPDSNSGGWHNEATGNDDGTVSLSIHNSHLKLSKETVEMLGLLCWKHAQRHKDKG